MNQNKNLVFIYSTKILSFGMTSLIWSFWLVLEMICVEKYSRGNILPLWDQKSKSHSLVPATFVHTLTNCAYLYYMYRNHSCQTVMETSENGGWSAHERKASEYLASDVYAQRRFRSGCAIWSESSLPAFWTAKDVVSSYRQRTLMRRLI